MNKLIFLLINNGFAASKDLGTVANNMQTKVNKIGGTAVVIGIMLAAVYMAMGRQEGTQKVSMAISGAVIFVLAASIFAFFNGL